MKHNQKKLFCFGVGYSAQVIAQNLIAQGSPNKWIVYGSYRDKNQPKVLTNIGIIPIHFGDAKAILTESDAILSSIPPDKKGDPVINQYKDLLAKISQKSWIGYLSTTGVYGDTKGISVDETAPIKPTNQRSVRRAVAEADWSKFATHIFRLPGIYGPNRSALDKMMKGAKYRINHPNHMFSRIHVEDIAQTVISSINNPNPGSIYNVCDDEAAEQQKVETYAAELLGVTLPPFISFENALKEMSPMAKTFWQDNRKVNNEKIKRELGIKLLYPTYREGLNSIYQSVQ